MNAITIRNLSKKFKIHHYREFQLKYMLIDLLRRRRSGIYSEFWALKEIGLDIPSGKIIGIIGVNGSGKSTLLKLISRILYPDEGSIAVKGKLSTLIELGSGFHPDLTGRENIFINASILGFSRHDIYRHFDTIVHFSELESFIDNPVRSYSTGMYVRLGFAVAIHVDPDILLVDEVPAVGDEPFQRKCMEKVSELREKGKTVMIVSHDLALVERLCDQVVLLHKGRVKMTGSPGEAITAYHRLLLEENNVLLANGPGTGAEMALWNSTRRWGAGEVEIEKVEFIDGRGQPSVMYRTGDEFRARIHYRAKKIVTNPLFGVAFHTDRGLQISGMDTGTDGFSIGILQGSGYIEFCLPKLLLLSGTYFFSAMVYGAGGQRPLDHREQNWKFHVLQVPSVTDRVGLVAMPRQWAHRRQDAGSE